jgi:bifunctional DNA-binding transcriptional regulator/antitoxin component of YhaV-PrlF toxin-antitoxin module
MSEQTETIRDTLEIGEDGRLTIKEPIRKALNIQDQKAFCEIETIGKDKIVIVILRRWSPTHRGPGKDVVKKL